MAQRPDNTQPLSSGVDALIKRLRDEGVSAGRDQGEKLLSEARAEAQQIVSAAKVAARQQLDNARDEVDAYRQAGEEALKTAMRDTVLSMKANLMEHFSADVARLVSQQLVDPQILRDMIIAIAGRSGQRDAIAEAEQLEVILPKHALGLETLRRDPDQLQHGRHAELVLGLAGEMLREGVTFAVSDDVNGGIHIQVKDGDVIIDISDRAVAQLILDHLQPRFRAMLDGVVH